MTSHSTTAQAAHVPVPRRTPEMDTALLPVATWEHETALAGENQSASTARDFVRLHLGAHDLAFLFDDMQLVVSELAANAVEHAGTPFTVNLSGDGASVLLTVHDGSSSAPVQLPPGRTSTGGRGMAIVDRLSDDWGVDHDDAAEKSVWASFLTP